MKSLFKITTILVAIALFAACSNHLKQGDDAYENLAYAKAIEHYEKALAKNSDPVAATRLADSYRLTNNHQQAEKWYAIAVTAPNATIETRLHYAKALLANGKTDLARRQAARILETNAANEQARNLVEACDIREQLQRAGDRYNITSCAFNAPEASDFCPAYYRNGLVFTSDRGAGAKSDWTGRAFTAIYAANTQSGTAEPLKGDVNGQYNDGAACFSTDGSVMYYTRNNYKGNERRKGSDNVVNLVLERARLQGDAWVREDFFPHNSPDFSTAHPALSADGRTLIFASDRPGGHGGMDLWKSVFDGSAWSEPANLGSTVNTEGSELFPYLAPDGLLVFASNGWPGLGGLDIFTVPLENGGYFAKPANAGAPVNSSKDDFGGITRDGMATGYFSSNRNSANGTEDIWTFERKPQPLQMNGIVVDKFTQIPLPGVRVDLQNKTNGKTQTTVSGDDGRFSFDLENNSDYRVSGLKNNIATTTKEESTRGKKPGETTFVQLEHNDPRFTLRGTAVTRKTGAPVQGVIVNLLNTGKKTEQTYTTDAEGKFFFQLEQNSDFVVSGQKDGVFASIKHASTRGLDRSTDLYVQLTLNVDILEIGMEIPLEDIYFDLNKHDIRPSAAVILDQLANFLVSNPAVEIELGSHTDSRNTQDYNQKLSQRRAESTVDYLLKKGVPRARLRAKGYGETQLVNRCADGVPCTEAEHQQNRRTAFRVLKF